MVVKTILAVAIGDPRNNTVFDTTAPDLSGVRPYIAGLVNWLANQTGEPKPDSPPPTKYNIGTDYKIVYRECAVADLAAAFQDALTLPTNLVFCMSTSVAKAANTWAQTQAPSMPIVAIVSDPFNESNGFGDNVCGVSASRDRLAISCFRKFKNNNTDVKKVYALHRDGYAPSVRATKWLGKKIIPVPVPDGGSIKTAIDGLTNRTNRGVLVLPADRFFGAAADIVTWSAPMPTFWSTPDFPATSYGGWGFEQGLCGQFLAERVATIWTNQDNGDDPMPDPRWVAIDPDNITLKIRPPLKKKPGKTAKAAKPAKRRSGAKK
jgi:hypothetical protein